MAQDNDLAGLLLDLTSMFVRPYPGSCPIEPFPAEGWSTVQLPALANQDEASRLAALGVFGPPDPGRYAALGAEWRPDRSDVLEVRVAYRRPPADAAQGPGRYSWISPEHTEAILDGVTKAQSLSALTTGTLTVDRGLSHQLESNRHAFRAVAFSLALLLWSMGASDNDWKTEAQPMPRQFWPPLGSPDLYDAGT